MVDSASPTLTPAAPPSSSPLQTAGLIAITIAALYYGRDILVPFALGILLSFALAPIVHSLQRFKFPRVVSILVAVALAFILIGGVAYLVGRQLVQLADNLPAYQDTITQKVRSLQQVAPSEGVVGKVTETLKELNEEISADEPVVPKPVITGAGEAGSETPEEPMVVRLEPPRARPLEVIQTVLGPLISPLATAGLVIIFVIFILLEKEDVRDRFIKLAGRGDLQMATQAIDDAAARVSRYLLMQLLVNFTYGIPVGIALYFIGVPNALLWGLLATILRFIPYLGPFLAALFPLALAVAVDPGWTMLFWVIGLFLTVELISNNVVEPWLYGSGTGLSSLAIILAAIFWTTLWGPVGLFLATPLTVCLVVIGRYVPQLEFLGVLLGSDPVLAPEERFYQRLLAGNLEEATDIAESYVGEHSAREFYDNVGIPALRFAENDRQRNTTDTNYRRTVAETAVDVVHDIADYVEERSKLTEPILDDNPSKNSAERLVLCLSGQSELDRAASEMLAQVLELKHIQASVLPPIAVSRDALGQIDLAGAGVIGLSYFHPQPQVYARYICRRLRRRAPTLRLAVCCWNIPRDIAHATDLATQMSADAVFVTLDACIEQIEAWLSTEMTLGPNQPDKISAYREEFDLESLRRLVRSAEWEQQSANIAKTLAASFGVTIALVSIPPNLSGQPLSGDKVIEEQTPDKMEQPLERHVIFTGETLIIEDIAAAAQFANNTYVLEKGIRFYAGTPLRTSSGEVIGVLSLIDMNPKGFSEAERQRLEHEAHQTVRTIERLLD